MKSITVSLTSAARSSWVIWPQPRSIIVPAELPHELRHVSNVAVHSGEFDDRIGIACDVERRRAHR
jgi:hypothetical protein